ncbi:MAG: hypothetical protein HC886_19480 [Leptolyngbyaceae cyanobacterium SM1_1_3]|nr:hypothetical protein [Leptolyngbyaceae cyanobacterium SM1_1_3]
MTVSQPNAAPPDTDSISESSEGQPEGKVYQILDGSLDVNVEVPDWNEWSVVSYSDPDNPSEDTEKITNSAGQAFGDRAIATQDLDNLLTTLTGGDAVSEENSSEFHNSPEFGLIDNGKYLVVAYPSSVDLIIYALQIWNVESGELKAHFAGSYAFLLKDKQQIGYMYLADKSVKVIDFTTGELVQTIPTATDKSVGFPVGVSPDGKVLLVAQQHGSSPSDRYIQELQL